MKSVIQLVLAIGKFLPISIWKHNKNLGGENQRPDPGHPFMKGDITT
ncbi:hypothetical protein X927_03165 [Petrotoga mexicana DSM 14811]|uniref:Uncharacterized protein n=1 Tax=Petrotoga mexicana DSM 14811 TaxID=1122954 RepID=A0A2K1PCP0_9BACT|nr:hypothetical protein X927_03165 [Petrotoga mexicana DSM 14811]